MNRLLIADLQLSDLDRDSYRWEIFPWLIKQINKHSIDCVYCLGDLTEKKNGHSDVLVNMLVECFTELSELCEVFILKGNHDFISEDLPFFNFLNKLENITMITDELVLNKDLFLAYSNDPVEVWKDVEFKKYENVFIHQFINGIGDTGNLPETYFKKYKGNVFSGHWHIPEVLNGVVYVGSPYPVDCGDDFVGRVIVLDDKNKQTSLEFKTIQKPSVIVESFKDFKALDLAEEDQVKVVVKVKTSNQQEWFEIKKKIQTYCDKKEVRINSISVDVEREIVKDKKEKLVDCFSDNKKMFKRFIKKEKIDDSIAKCGLRLLCRSN